MRGPIAILELVRGRFGYVSVALGQSVFGSIEIRTRFYRKALCSSLRGLINIHRLCASFECVLVVYGGLAEGLGCGRSALIRVISIFGNCTRYVRGAR
ncbi:hypothetical protein F2Q69_00006672 [Brassica cretica]|uniref:Uncharacterized protein n=1 Tax=Brassica cretica TaxID=69181 RepID=A0A8S9PRU7_BRACR|nr:hypothetical protein F2Q69_00006672 [Brassica cretica]